ncbi:MAG: uracil phosphoribosyltransferase, partial [Bacteroidales bacterium]
MKINNLSETNSVLNQFLAEMRDKTLQKDSMRFRTNLERIGRIFAYEISKTLNYKKVDVETPLGIAGIMVPDEQLVVGTILR